LGDYAPSRAADLCCRPTAAAHRRTDERRRHLGGRRGLGTQRV